MSIEIDNNELDKYLNIIFTGSKFVEIDDIFLIFKQPDNLINMKAQLIYESALDQALKDGFLSRDKIEELIEERGIFTEFDRDKISRLESKLEGQRVLLGKTTKVKANQDRLKKVIKDLEEQISEIRIKKSSKLMMSAETKAEEERYNFLCWACTYNELNERYWFELNDFMKEIDIDFRDKVLSSFARFYNGFTIDIIRYIARNNLWRIRYITSQKTSDPLFGRPTTDYTPDMLNLAFWTNYYNNIYEMMPEDRPSDSIIEDDEALDAYMNSFYEERNRNDAARKSKRVSSGKLSAFDREEVIITQSNPLYEDIQYDKPREAQRIKDRTSIRKKVKHSRK